MAPAIFDEVIGPGRPGVLETGERRGRTAPSRDSASPPAPGGCRLTRLEMSHQSGCLCKLPACALEDLLGNSYRRAAGPEEFSHPMQRPEDCASLEVGGQTLLASTDLGPLVGVDLFLAGRIAALHAMSDIYACGGLPLHALVTLVVRRDFPGDYMEAVMAGILQAAREEGVEILGGHTLVGEEAMAGLTVIGRPRAGSVLRKSGAQIGDRLLLSKPLGVGLVVRAYKLGLAGEEELQEAVGVMTTSNGPASARIVAAGVRAATDVTGFGLLGHLTEMLLPGQGAVIELAAVPVLASAARLAGESGHTPWTEGNLDYVASKRVLRGGGVLSCLLPLLDPQTNGGLLVAAAPGAAATLGRQGFAPVGSVTGSNAVELSP